MDVRWGGGEGGPNQEVGIDIYTLPCVKQLVGTCKHRELHLCSVMTQRGGMGCGGKEPQEGGDLGMLHYRADTNIVKLFQLKKKVMCYRY